MAHDADERRVGRELGGDVAARGRIALVVTLDGLEDDAEVLDLLRRVGLLHGEVRAADHALAQRDRAVGERRPDADRDTVVFAPPVAAAAAPRDSERHEREHDDEGQVLLDLAHAHPFPPT